MKSLYLALALLTSVICLSSQAYAQIELEQFEENGEAMASKMNQLFVVQNPQVAEFLPEVAWNDGFRASAKCMIDLFRTEGGDDFITQMLANGKEFVTKEFTSFTDFQEHANFMPEGLSQARQIEISGECGMTKLTIDRIQGSGFAQALQSLPE